MLEAVRKIAERTARFNKHAWQHKADGRWCVGHDASRIANGVPLVPPDDRMFMRLGSGMPLKVFALQPSNAERELVAAAIGTDFAKRFAPSAAGQPWHLSTFSFIQKAREARPCPSVLPETAQVACFQMCWVLVLRHMRLNSWESCVVTFRRLLAFADGALIKSSIRRRVARA